jgi:sec-independent protein translocase protein TatA
MPNIGPAELIIILVIALLVIGPGRLPDVGAALGKSIREFRKASSDMAEATRIDTAPLPPAAGTTTTPTPQPAPVPNVLSNPAAVSPVDTAPDPIAVPPTTPSDGSTGQTS